MEGFIRHPLGSLDADVIHFIREYYVDPPNPKGTYKFDFEITRPPWKSLGKWGEAYKFIIEYFTFYKVRLFDICICVCVYV